MKANLSNNKGKLIKMIFETQTWMTIWSKCKISRNVDEVLITKYVGKKFADMIFSLFLDEETF